MGMRLNQPRVVVQAMLKRCKKEWWLLNEREGMSHEAWMHNTWGGWVGRLSQNWNVGCWREQWQNWGVKNDEMRMEDKDTWGILKTVGNMCKSRLVWNREKVMCFMLNGWATVTMHMTNWWNSSWPDGTLIPTLLPLNDSPLRPDGPSMLKEQLYSSGKA